MGRIVAIGERHRIDGYVLAGVDVLAADRPDAARQEWAALAGDVELVILTRGAHAALADQLSPRARPLWVVMPE